MAHMCVWIGEENNLLISSSGVYTARNGESSLTK